MHSSPTRTKINNFNFGCKFETASKSRRFLFKSNLCAVLCCRMATKSKSTAATESMAEWANISKTKTKCAVWDFYRWLSLKSSAWVCFIWFRCWMGFALKSRSKNKLFVFYAPRAHSSEIHQDEWLSKTHRMHKHTHVKTVRFVQVTWKWRCDMLRLTV